MIERLQSYRFFTHQLARPLAITWGVGAMFLFAYLVDPAEARLLPGVLFILVGIAGFVLARFQEPDVALTRLMVGFGAVTALGLLLLPGGEQWAWWAALAGASLLPLSQLPLNLWRIYPALTIGGGFAGAILAETRTQNADVIVLGLGILLIGSATTRRTRPVVAKPEVSMNEPLVDLNEIPVLSREELAQLSTRLHVTVDGLVRAVQAINDVTTQQADGANEQVDVIQMTNDMMNNFLTMSERISEQARAMSQTAQQTSQMSSQGQRAITEAIDGMDKIRQQVSEIASTIVRLAQLTRRIDEIITSVSEIATQSNLLALNASIEAARAGVHGRGFAVVADEVRSLSQQSTSAAFQVRAILAEIRDAVKQTISATEAGMEGVDAGIAKTQESDRIMLQLAANVDSSSNAVRAIYDVLRQQTDGLEEIAINMERIDRITQQNLASTRMVSTVSNNLNRLADELQNSIQVGQQATATMVMPTVSLD